MSTLPVHHLGIGDIIIATEASIISTVLGSCVSVCLFSKATGIGGMNHFAHPTPASPGGVSDFRYGRMAIETMIDEFAAATQERPDQWTAKIVGGAHENMALRNSFDIGQANADIAREVLSAFRVPVVGQDIGGQRGRKVLFHSATNRLQVALLKGREAVPAPPGEARPARRKRVLVVDDSRTVRDLIKQLLSDDSELEIVGFAADAFEAAKLLVTTRPDVITLDVNMPGKSGVEWLREFMPVHPTPVVMISSLELREGNEIFRALELGAVDFVQKPSLQQLPTLGPIIRERIKAAAQAKIVKVANLPRGRTLTAPAQIDLRKVVAIGASTGGTEALKHVLMMLPERIPPTLIVQHIPPIFSKTFADRLNELCPFEVREAEDGDEIRQSRVLIAPGGQQMRVCRRPSGIYVEVSDGAPVNRHKPSVDFLFDSVAAVYGKNSVGVILTGMGADGARGLLRMREAGARTIAQDEDSCVVFGMPKEAIRLGAAATILPLTEVAKGILSSLERLAA